MSPSAPVPHNGPAPPPVANPPALAPPPPSPTLKGASSASSAGSDASDATLVARAPRTQPDVIMGTTGEWDLGPVIGEGTFSTVRLARHRASGLEAVCKSTTVRAHQPHYRLYALRELAILLSVPPHPTIPALYDAVVTEGPDTPSSPDPAPFGAPATGTGRPPPPPLPTTGTVPTYHIFMQRAKGIELFAYAKRSPDGRCSEDEARVILGQVADGLAHLHAHSVLHRDLKLDNAVVDPRTLRVTLIDFNLSALCWEGAAMAEPVGCINYASPQVLSSALTGLPYYPQGGRPDLHALGVLAYGLLVGYFPFRSASPQSLLAEICARGQGGARLHWPAAPPLPGAPPGAPLEHLVPRAARRMVEALLDPAEPARAEDVAESRGKWAWTAGWRGALARLSGTAAPASPPRGSPHHRRSHLPASPSSHPPSPTFSAHPPAAPVRGFPRLDPLLAFDALDHADLARQARALERYCAAKMGWGGARAAPAKAPPPPPPSPKPPAARVAVAAEAYAAVIGDRVPGAFPPPAAAGAGSPAAGGRRWFPDSPAAAPPAPAWRASAPIAIPGRG